MDSKKRFLLRGRAPAYDPKPIPAPAAPLRTPANTPVPIVTPTPNVPQPDGRGLRTPRPGALTAIDLQSLFGPRHHNTSEAGTGAVVHTRMTMPVIGPADYRALVGEPEVTFSMVSQFVGDTPERRQWIFRPAGDGRLDLDDFNQTPISILESTKSRLAGVLDTLDEVEGVEVPDGFTHLSKYRDFPVINGSVVSTVQRLIETAPPHMRTRRFICDLGRVYCTHPLGAARLTQERLLLVLREYDRKLHTVGSPHDVETWPMFLDAREFVRYAGLMWRHTRTRRVNRESYRRWEDNARTRIFFDASQHPVVATFFHENRP